MTKDEITFLMNNGFSLADIMTMQKPADPKPDEPKPNEIESLKAKIAELKKWYMWQQNVE